MLNRRHGIILTMAALCALAAPPLAAAAPPPADFSQGAFHGRVVDAADGRPVAGATVALRDKGGKVVAWAMTDATGRYAVAAETLKVLRLQPSRRRGLLARIAGTVGKVVTAPVKIVAGALREVDPVKTARSAAVSTVTGSAAPVASRIAEAAAHSVTDKTGRKTRETAARAVLGERQASPKQMRDQLLPGEVIVSVSAAGYKGAQGKAGAYWLEPPAAGQAGARAWLETVKLAALGGDKKSEVSNMALLLAEPRMEPAMAPPGTTVTLTVRLKAPGEPTQKVRVFAREDRTRAVVELTPRGGGLFAGDLPLGPKTPIGDTTVTVAALRAEPVEVDLRESEANPLLHFAERLDDLEAGRAYEFDPRIMASENRLDLALTVLDPKRATPPSAPERER